MPKADEYLSLITSYIDGKIDTKSFSRMYLEKFKNERSELPEDAFEILDRLFGDVDSYTDDEELLASMPSFYLSAEQLKEQAAMAAAELANGV
ncbi:colicin immunity domain-containing protein [Stenotrophomonas maltophilia]|uniref:Colicin D immunity protein domain-containing protein n=1 Tax=Stenotrophomonas maltophilia TaxID=40324 RepID=A0AAI9C8J8_STEMA|nr:colicin immunity domain-containing protein [Stenotrophomonas maltophilia]EKT4440062.1 hypothetical protein [Stenotrophomonas maltophilia]ELC7363556.1 hypothetical protein [Stenotrophomonas maltophilia]MBH1631848.1 hypothetical protein [Stenotrophomonas maltophilia]MBN4991564.1 hypothetical protein [Stenotrophomonas maltophilia]MBN5013481.1 hypothetical protein [Stenotrophomonas maltophilia]